MTCSVIHFFQTLYDAWFISFYNVFFTSAPVVFLGVLDQVGIMLVTALIFLALQKGHSSTGRKHRRASQVIGRGHSSLFPSESSRERRAKHVFINQSISVYGARHRPIAAYTGKFTRYINPILPIAVAEESENQLLVYSKPNFFIN